MTASASWYSQNAGRPPSAVVVGLVVRPFYGGGVSWLPLGLGFHLYTCHLRPVIAYLSLGLLLRLPGLLGKDQVKKSHVTDLDDAAVVHMDDTVVCQPP